MAQDVVEILAQDHAALIQAADRLRRETPTPRRSQIFNQFARMLGAHLAIIDDTVIPELKGLGWRGVSSAMLTAHVELKRSLAELLTQRGSPAFQDALSRLATQLQAQIDSEKAHLFPLLRQCLDESHLAFLGLDAHARRSEILGDGVEDGDPANLRGVDELLEEAQVVLSSLPNSAVAADASAEPARRSVTP